MGGGRLVWNPAMDCESETVVQVSVSYTMYTRVCVHNGVKGYVCVQWYTGIVSVKVISNAHQNSINSTHKHCLYTVCVRRESVNVHIRQAHILYDKNVPSEALYKSDHFLGRSPEIIRSHLQTHSSALDRI